MRNPVLKKLHMEDKEFVTSEEIKSYCSTFDINYYNTIRNLLSRGYLLRIFRGIFYVKTLEEVKFGKTKYSHLDLVSRGMELKGVSAWYFGLNTALKMNNATHEHFTVEHVLNDSIFRRDSMEIAGHEFKFTKLKKELFGFGVIEDPYMHSDIDKTILDFIYLWRYNGKEEKRILMDISEYREYITEDRIRRYAEHYPKTVKQTMEELL
ncbi:MAG: hypothetical protein R6U61_05935 [Thermoplasmata archaeon]